MTSAMDRLGRWLEWDGDCEAVIKHDWGTCNPEQDSTRPEWDVRIRVAEFLKGPQDRGHGRSLVREHAIDLALRSAIATAALGPPDLIAYYAQHVTGQRLDQLAPGTEFVFVDEAPDWGWHQPTTHRVLEQKAGECLYELGLFDGVSEGEVARATTLERQVLAADDPQVAILHLQTQEAFKLRRKAL